MDNPFVISIIQESIAVNLYGRCNNSFGKMVKILKNIKYPPRDRIEAAPSDMASSRLTEKDFFSKEYLEAVGNLFL